MDHFQRKAALYEHPWTSILRHQTVGYTPEDFSLVRILAQGKRYVGRQRHLCIGVLRDGFFCSIDVIRQTSTGKLLYVDITKEEVYEDLAAIAITKKQGHSVWEI